MEKFRAIPEGYMRIGEMAKRASVTVRTLQYYDKEGLLSPSAESEGGFRLYTEKDMAKLIQILLMKELGFPLSEIKKRCSSMDTPADVVNVLTEQANQIRSKIAVLSETLNEIEALKEEIVQMETVDFKKYSVILVNLQIKNKNYWMIRHFDDDILEKLGESMNREEAEKIIAKTNRLYDEAALLQNKGVSPESEIGQKFAKEFWEMMLDVTGGDFELMEKMNDHVVKILISDDTQNKNFMEMNRFIQPALMFYLNNQGESLLGTTSQLYHEAGRLHGEGSMGTANRLYIEAGRLQKDGVSPESKAGQRFAKEFWESMLEITGGNIEMMQKMSDQVEKIFLSDADKSESYIGTKRFMELALEYYLSNPDAQ